MRRTLPALSVAVTLLLASACAPGTDPTGPEAAEPRMEVVPGAGFDVVDNGGMFGNGNRGEYDEAETTPEMDGGAGEWVEEEQGPTAYANNGGMFGNGN